MSRTFSGWHDLVLALQRYVLDDRILIDDRMFMPSWCRMDSVCLGSSTVGIVIVELKDVIHEHGGSCLPVGRVGLGFYRVGSGFLVLGHVFSGWVGFLVKKHGLWIVAGQKKLSLVPACCIGRAGSGFFGRVGWSTLRSTRRQHLSPTLTLTGRVARTRVGLPLVTLAF